MLEIQKILIEHPDNWKSILTEKPYCLSIKEKDNLIIFNYNQIDSDFDIPLVQECRGIILERDTFKVISMRFKKFWNVQEGRSANIDLGSAKVQEKIDGSIIAYYYYNNKWNISTMSMIDANECTLQNDLNSNYKTFADLVNYALNEELNKTILAAGCLFFDTNYTYIFEIVSPYNRVVIPYQNIKLYHIGTRNNITLEELNVDIGIEKPKEYKFNSMNDVIKMAEKLPFNEEGYVVVDKYWNRVKIKSPSYLAVHHLHNNGNLSKRRALELILLNEHEAFLSYFNEYKEFFDEIEFKFVEYLNKIQNDINDAFNKTFETKKDFALYVKNMTYCPIMFQIYDKKIKKEDWEKHIRSIPSDKLEGYLKL